MGLAGAAWNHFKWCGGWKAKKMYGERSREWWKSSERRPGLDERRNMGYDFNMNERE